MASISGFWNKKISPSTTSQRLLKAQQGESADKRSLLSSRARLQAPWIKVTIGNFTFGVYVRDDPNTKDDQDFYTSVGIQYPSYVNSLHIEKINGQVNSYTLTLNYPVALGDDPNFFEKVLGSVSNTRKIIFSYGDAMEPAYAYMDEEAIITNVTESFSFGNSGTMNSVITYTISAVSSVGLNKATNFNFPAPGGAVKPSEEIKRILRDPKYGLTTLLTGMDNTNIDVLIAGDDKPVKLESKITMPALDYISYLASCMVPSSSSNDVINADMYILTLHDDSTTNDAAMGERALVNGKEISGPYIKVTRTDTVTTRSDAYEIDIGVPSSTIVTSFQISNQESYSIYFNYQEQLNNKRYVRRLNTLGQWEDVEAYPLTTDKTLLKTTNAEKTWWKKLTQYPISATITIQGLLRPAYLMQYVRLNVLFPGGRKHISSGLYIVTKQVDDINESGYRTTLSLTRIDGDTLGDSVLTPSGTASGLI